jgi:hypothetical protein
MVVVWDDTVTVTREMDHMGGGGGCLGNVRKGGIVRYKSLFSVRGENRIILLTLCFMFYVEMGTEPWAVR